MVARNAVDTHLRSTCADIEALLATNIFSTEEASGPLFKAAYVWLILSVHVLLSKLASTPNRVTLPGAMTIATLQILSKKPDMPLFMLEQPLSATHVK